MTVLQIWSHVINFLAYVIIIQSVPFTSTFIIVKILVGKDGYGFMCRPRRQVNIISCFPNNYVYVDVFRYILGCYKITNHHYKSLPFASRRCNNIVLMSLFSNGPHGTHPKWVKFQQKSHLIILLR